MRKYVSVPYRAQETGCLSGLAVWSKRGDHIGVHTSACTLVVNTAGWAFASPCTSTGSDRPCSVLATDREKIWQENGFCPERHHTLLMAVRFTDQS